MTHERTVAGGRGTLWSNAHRLASCGAVLSLAMSCTSSPPPPRNAASTPPAATAPPAGSAVPAAIAPPAANRTPDEPPAARQFAAWLAAFNAGDRAQLLAYHENSFPYAVAARDLTNIDRELEFRDGTGGFELKKAAESTATRFVAILKERGSDQFARAEMEVDDGEPHSVKHFEIHATATPDEFRAPRMSQADAVDALRAELEKEVADDRFSGAVIVAKDGVPIFAQAYGLADRERKVANKLDTRFRIGSMNKMFTAVATLQLVQSGKLALTDPLGKILPRYKNPGVASKVTIHHLLTHTGGTGDIFGPQFDAHRLELRTLQDYLKLYGARDLEFEPGARWEYSNYGFILLGAVIEKLTRQTYYDWVSAHVFKPAGMTSTASPIEGHAEPGRSIGYMKEHPASPWASAADTLPYRGTSAGGGDSTVGDLLKFANALAGHKLLDAERTELLTTGKVETPGGGKYAYGFGDHIDDGVRCYGHSGGAPGMNGVLDICESGYTIAVLANLDPPAANRAATFIKNRLPAK